MMEVIKTIRITKQNILNSIDFSMHDGEMVAIMGPSGSGKSTLLYMLSGMDKVDDGKIMFSGEDIAQNSEDENSKIRLEKMGFVFQQMNMLSNLNIIDNIILPALQNQRVKAKKDRLSESQLRQKAIALMTKIGISGLEKRKITEVSGGQLQRACICRALINNPKILFADEPTGALNRSYSDEVMREFIRLNKEGMSTLIVTHDSKIASACDRVVYLIDGVVKGECILGKHNPKMQQDRESTLSKWLEYNNW